MPRQPERILLFRSGRHLGTALVRLRAEHPGCEITVVSTPFAVTALDSHGLDAAHRILFEDGAFFSPLRFFLSDAGRKSRRGGFDYVCVLWNDPKGTGQSNVDRTALTVSPLGFTAITADGTLIPTRPWSAATRELASAAWSVVVGAGLVALLFLPSRLLRPFRA